MTRGVGPGQASARVRLPGGGETTRLGFGCSNLLGDKTAAEGLALLEAAWDAGIRHFDVAPYYGYGHAEELLGVFARGRRDEITIATKVGLEPLVAPGRLDWAVGLVRRAMRASPRIRSLVSRSAPFASRSGRFDVPSVRRRLETSLRLLGTERIDVYLLHECGPADCTDELLAFLEDARREGKIRSFGLATSVAATAAVRAERPAFAEVVQVHASLDEPYRAAGDPPGQGGPGRPFLLTHGSLLALPALRTRIDADSALAARLERQVGFDPRDDRALAALLLRHAMASNPGGAVLFRSASRERIAANVRGATGSGFEPAQVEAFARLASGREAGAFWPSGRETL